MRHGEEMLFIETWLPLNSYPLLFQVQKIIRYYRNKNETGSRVIQIIEFFSKDFVTLSF